MSQSLSLRVAAVAAAGLVLAGCATTSPQQNQTAMGAGAGAAIGAGLGALIGDSSRAALIGAGIGALAGGVAGYNWDAIRGRVEGAGASNMGVDVTEQPDGSLKVNVPSTVSFDTDSYALKPALYPVLNAVAQSLVEHRELRAIVVGHTDSTGALAYNQTLSQNRARSVVNYLARQGVASNRLMAEGRGPNDPIASNDTAAGRAQNRRVEIYLYRPQ